MTSEQKVNLIEEIFADERICGDIDYSLCYIQAERMVLQECVDEQLHTEKATEIFQEVVDKLLEVEQLMEEVKQYM